MSDMKRIALFLSIFVVACTTPSYSGIDRPNIGGNGSTDMAIIDYIDQRLEGEYYWLDEVAKKCNSFDRGVAWEDYLDGVLSRLTTNVDDGYLTPKGQRVYYSYIRELQSGTRSETTGFGIDLYTTVVVVDRENNQYGFVVENVYAGSPAEAAGIRRGDVIVKVNNGFITPNNYASLFNLIYYNKQSTVTLQVRRQLVMEGDEATFAAELTAKPYTECMVPHSEIIEGDKRVGYVVYSGFESHSDDILLGVLRGFAEEGIRDVILDLRTNGGGSLSSAVKLSSTLLSASFEGATLCEVRRNPKNRVGKAIELFQLTAMEYHLDIDHLTVITSNHTASASELVIMGLRGLDIPVTLVGSATQGKNCGMDVTRRTIGTTYFEYAPITFMCFNAKGVGDWGEGIAVDVDVKAEEEHYPMPYVPWGSKYVKYDAALRLALEHLGILFDNATRGEDVVRDVYPSQVEIAMPMEGIRLYE